MRSLYPTRYRYTERVHDLVLRVDNQQQLVDSLDNTNPKYAPSFSLSVVCYLGVPHASLACLPGVAFRSKSLENGGHPDGKDNLRIARRCYSEYADNLLAANPKLNVLLIVRFTYD